MFTAPYLISAALQAAPDSSLQSLTSFLLINYINRAFLCFQVGFGQVLSQDPCTEELNASHEENDTYGRCPTLNRIAYNKLSNNYKKDSDE